MFNKARAGFFKKNLSGKLEYKSFCPSKLPPNPGVEVDKELIDLLLSTHKTLAILDDRAQNIPDMNLFVSMYVQKEALLSSQIEGTQATLEDIFDPNRDENINKDVTDVVNYIKATNYAIERLDTLPLCKRLLLETHKILLSGVRGEEKNPGEFRKSQNWIGGAGSTLKTARYIPPNPLDMDECLSDLEIYINENEEYDVLMNAALIHYQFETIHPFLDGNGRIGRLLMVLYLLDKKVIETPALYLSYYLKENRIEYYDRMTAVRETGNYEQWIKFFIEGIFISAKFAIETADELIQIKERDKKLIEDYEINSRAKNTLNELYGYIISHPVIDIPNTAKSLSLSYNTVSTAISRLEDLNILSEITNQSRGKIYSYDSYLKILKRGTQNI